MSSFTNKLSNAEGQRVMQVLDETLQATTMVSCISSELIEREEAVRQVLEPEVRTRIERSLRYGYSTPRQRQRQRQRRGGAVTATAQGDHSTMNRTPGRGAGVAGRELDFSSLFKHTNQSRRAERETLFIAASASVPL